MTENNLRPLMYVGTHATDDPTLASLPFLVATGAGKPRKAGDDRRRPRGWLPAAEGACREGQGLRDTRLRLRLVRGRPWGDRGGPCGTGGAVHRSCRLLSDGRRAQRGLLLRV